MEWQPVLMTGMMWMANVVGEYLTRMDRRPEVSPVKLPRLIDDSVSMLWRLVADYYAIATVAVIDIPVDP